MNARAADGSNPSIRVIEKKSDRKIFFAINRKTITAGRAWIKNTRKKITGPKKTAPGCIFVGKRKRKKMIARGNEMSNKVMIDLTKLSSRFFKIMIKFTPAATVMAAKIITTKIKKKTIPLPSLFDHNVFPQLVVFAKALDCDYANKKLNLNLPFQDKSTYMHNMK